VPVELGAEFIHGKEPGLWELVQRAHLRSQPVTDRHWLQRDSKWSELRGFWEELARIIGQIDLKKGDQSFAEFLRARQDISPDWKQLATDFVEGFNAARTERISIHALAKDQQASERIHGDESFRISTGYSGIIEWLELQLKARRVPVHCGLKVKTIHWETGAVAVSGESAEGSKTFTASHAVITLPLGVLKAGEVTFEPEVLEKKEAIDGLEMGKVVKVNLQFRSCFWPEPNFGFIHSSDDWLPTWWTHEQANMLTGWAGGSRAERMAEQSEDFVVAQAFLAVSRIFKVEERKVKDELEAVYFHDWTADPFARGAYSYIPVGLLNAQQRLADPLRDTIFFAGEAATLDAQLGTVHGAIGSGKHAARELLRSIKL